MTFCAKTVLNYLFCFPFLLLFANRCMLEAFLLSLFQGHNFTQKNNFTALKQSLVSSDNLFHSQTVFTHKKIICLFEYISAAPGHILFSIMWFCEWAFKTRHFEKYQFHWTCRLKNICEQWSVDTTPAYATLSLALFLLRSIA